MADEHSSILFLSGFPSLTVAEPTSYSVSTFFNAPHLPSLLKALSFYSVETYTFFPYSLDMLKKKSLPYVTLLTSNEQTKSPFTLV